MQYSEALEIVHGLAARTQVDETDIASGDAGLSAQRDWQREALDTLEDFVVNHGEEVDDRYAVPAAVPAHPAEAVAAERAMAPGEIGNAIRICLAMADDVPEQDASAVEAIALAGDFVVRHGDALAADIATIRLA